MTTVALWSLLLLSHDARPEPSFLTPAPRPGRTMISNVTVIGMQRNVDDADPSDEQPGGGVEFDTYRPGGPGWEIGISTSSDEENVGIGDFEATVSEIYGGTRRTWGAKRSGFHPYVAGGLSFIRAEADLSGFGSEDDTTFGLYGRGGAYWTIGEHFNIGADFKAVVGTDLDFGDADYVQLGVSLGYSF